MNPTSLSILVVGFAAMAGISRAAPERGPAAPELPFIAIAQVDKAPTIDGALEDDCWDKAVESKAFTDESSFPVGEATTTFKICQAGETMYLGLKCAYAEKQPPPDKTPIPHDGNTWMIEEFELFLDPDMDDSPGYYQFAITANGDTGDWFCRQSLDAEGRWQPAYHVKSHRTDKEWTAEFAIPLAVFSETKAIYENFGAQVVHLYKGLRVWAPHHGESLHFPHLFGEVRGLKGANVLTNTPGLFRSPFMRVNDRAIHAAANPSLIPGQPPRFVGAPKIKTNRKNLAVSFAVNTRTDVGVWIEDEQGNRVKHLAAGLLGSNAPAPLQRTGLEQTVAWDYTDDAGKRVPPGRYRVKVGAGSKAELDKVIGWDPTPKNINGLGIDQAGNLYAVGGIRDEWLDVYKFSRDGAYLQSLYPPPGELPPEKLKGMNIIDYGADGRAIFGSHRTAAWLPHLDLPMPHSVLVNSKGQVIVFGCEYLGGPAHLYKINPDGSLPDDFIGPYIKEVMWTQYYAEWGKRFHFALDPRDENIIVVSGLKETHRTEMDPDETKDRRATFYNAVCRVTWGRQAMPETFIGKRNITGMQGGTTPGEFQDPQGLCFDADANLWVCDRGNNRIQVFDHKGKFIRMFSHPRPYEIIVSRKTGEVYILGTETNGAVTITKYKAGKDPEILAKTGSLGKESYWNTMALDESRGAEIKFVRNKNCAPYEILRIIDLGASFGEPETIVGKTPPRNYERVVAGWNTDIICAGRTWFDAATGAIIGSRARGDEIFSARDGSWAVREGFFDETITFFPSNWPTNPRAEPLRRWKVTPPSLNRNKANGFCVAPNGDVYVARYYQWHGQSGARAGTEGSDMHMAIDHYSGDGKLLRQRVVYELSHAGQSPVVDIRGNIYCVDNVGRKIGQLYEDDIAANLPTWFLDYKIDWDKIRRGERDAAGWEKFVNDPLIKSIGTVYKFGPKGGGLIWRIAQGDYEQLMPQYPDTTNESRRINEGKYLDWGYPFKPRPTTPPTHWSATWVTLTQPSGVFPRWQDGVEYEFLGVGPAWGRYNKGHSSCVCVTCRIAVDDFGRVYAPAPHRGTVRMIDTAGNEVLRIGRYGNMDAHKPGTKTAGTEIALRYPATVSLSKRFLYLGEHADARVLKVKLGFADEATIDAVVPQ